MKLLPFINQKAEYVYKNLSGNVGKVLLYTGAASWILSSFAHVVAILINKDIDKDQKAFLVPQEMADAAVNIALFIAVTRSFTKFGENLVKRGKFITKEIAKGIENDAFSKKIGEKFTTEIKSNITKTFSKGLEDLEKGLPAETVENTVTKRLEIPDLQAFKTNKAFQQTYYKFFDGVSFISSTVGSIISCNLLTPYFRNMYAAKKQKFDLKKSEVIHPTVLFDVPKISMDDFRQKIIAKPRNLTSNSSIKI